MTDAQDPARAARRDYQQGYAAYTRGDFAAAVRLLKKAAQEYERVADPNGVVKSTKCLGDVLEELGQTTAALSAYQSVVSFSGKCDSKSYELLCAYNLLAIHYHTQGDHKRAVHHAKEAATIQGRRDPAGNGADTGRMYASLGMFYEAAGEPAEALRNMEQGAAILDRIPDLRQDAARTHQRVAGLYERLGQPARAIIHIEKARALGGV